MCHVCRRERTGKHSSGKPERGTEGGQNHSCVPRGTGKRGPVQQDRNGDQ